MRKDLLTDAEDMAFSEAVIRYNARKDQRTDTEEGRYIKERTKELVYLICKEQLLMNDDMISSVFLNIYDDLEKVIRSYRIASHSFNHYLKQVCIYRIRRVRKNPGTRRSIEAEYMSESCEFYSVDEDHTTEEKEHPLYSILMCNPTRFAAMTMTDVTKYIVEQRSWFSPPVRSRRERILKNKLERKYFRRNFLLFILSLPPGGDEEKDAKNYARVFQVDEAAFARLLYLKNEIIRRSYPERDRNLEKAAMHWRMMARIKNSMYRASSQEEYRVLKENYLSQVRCHRNRLEDASRCVKGVIHEDIASAMGLSRSTVSMGICLIRKELERISDLNFT